MKKNKFFNNNAVSQVVSALLSLAIVIAAVIAIMGWGVPYIEERKLKNQVQNSVSSFDIIYNTLSGMIMSGSGDKGTGELISTTLQGSLEVTTSGEDKQIILYSYNQLYDFNVSGLNDNDDEFNLEPDSTNPFSTDDIKIYWLQKNETTSISLTNKIKKIYLNNRCSQRFTPPNGVLDQVRIKVAKTGNPTSFLNVSIYDNNSGQPGEMLVNMTIPPENITSEYKWIDCNLTDGEDGTQSLSDLNDYYIVVNTSDGSNYPGAYNYYTWQLHSGWPYENGKAYTSSDGGASWFDENLRYNYHSRFFYAGIEPPTSAEITMTQDEFKSGIEQQLTLEASSITPNLEYRVFWGDNKNTSWTLTQSGVPYTGFSHAWAKPGNYTITTQVRDTEGNINKTDNITTVEVTEGDYLPLDIYDVQSRDYDGNPVTAKKPLTGNLRIDLFSISFEGGRLPIAKIWVFDTRALKYASSQSSGAQFTVLQNGAIIASGPIQNGVTSYPSIFENEDAFAIRFIQFTGSVFANGKGTYKLGFTIEDSYSREPGFPVVYNLKLQIINKDENLQQTWMNFLKDSYNFTTDSTANVWEPYTLYCQPNGISLLLESSSIETELKGITP